MGRPTKYKKEYCEKIIEYFDRELITYNQDSDGKILTSDKGLPIIQACELPMFGKFAVEICDVAHDTLIDWSKRHVEFGEAYKKAKALQENILANNGLLGRYNPTMAIFTLKNVSLWRDKKELEHSGPDQGPIKFEDIKKMTDQELFEEIEKKLQ